MKKIIAAIVFVIIAHAHTSLCMEGAIVNRNPRSIKHLLQNDGEWLEQLTEGEACGNYSHDLCCAREILKKTIGGESVYNSSWDDFPGAYAEDEEWLSKQFGKKAACLAINAVQQISVASRVRDYMMRWYESHHIYNLNDFVKERLCDERPFNRLNLATHFSDKDGETLLHCAASKPLLNKIIKTMLSHHSKPDLLDAYGRSPFFYAMKHGAVENMFTLLEGGADPYLQDCNGFSPLHAAAEYDQYQCINGIDRNGVFSGQKNDFGDTPLHLALKKRASVKTIESLIQGFAFNCTVRDQWGYAYLDVAIEHKQTESGRLILADLNKRLLNTSGFCDIFEEIIKCGADVTAQNAEGKTLLHRKDLDEKTLRMLIKHGVDVNRKDKNGRKPLAVGVDFWSSDMVAILLDAGALVTPEMYNILRCGSGSGNKWRVFQLVIDAYKKQECCVCLHYLQDLFDATECSFGCIPCTNNHRGNFICEGCYKTLPALDGKKKCPMGCEEPLGDFQ